jgi:hypothetical protein
LFIVAIEPEPVGLPPEMNVLLCTETSGPDPLRSFHVSSFSRLLLFHDTSICVARRLVQTDDSFPVTIDPPYPL